MDDLVKAFFMERYENLDRLDRDLVARSIEPNSPEKLGRAVDRTEFHGKARQHFPHHPYDQAYLQMPWVVEAGGGGARRGESAQA